MGTYYTQGIILKHQNFREADRLVTIYTKEYGKINAIAKGSRKITSKLAGGLEPFILANFMLARGRQFDTVAATDVIENFRQLRNNLEKIFIAGYLTNLVSQSTSEQQRDSKIYNLLKEVFFWLESSNQISEKKNYVIWYFIWQYLALLGYQPELTICIVCKKEIKPDKNFFDFKKGGLVCSRCYQSNNEQRPVSNNVIKLLRFIQSADLESFERIKIDKKTFRAFNTLTIDYLNYTQEQEFNFINSFTD